MTNLHLLADAALGTMVTRLANAPMPVTPPSRIGPALPLRRKGDRDGGLDPSPTVPPAPNVPPTCH